MAGRSKPTHCRQGAGTAALPRVGAPRSRKPPANDNRLPSALLVYRLVGILTFIAALAVLLWIGITSL